MVVGGPPPSHALYAALFRYRRASITALNSAAQAKTVAIGVERNMVMSCGDGQARTCRMRAMSPDPPILVRERVIERRHLERGRSGRDAKRPPKLGGSYQRR